MLVTHGSHFQAVSSELEILSQDQILHPSTLLSLSLSGAREIPVAMKVTTVKLPLDDFFWVKK